MAIGKYPEFSWSVSRAGLFEYCRRKYYYHYYGSWGGWDGSAEERCRLIYLLKNRTTLAEWVGHNVHEAVSKYLAEGKDMARIIRRTRQIMRAEFLHSRKREFLQPGKAKSFGLVNHYYGDPLGDGDVKNAWAHVEQCLEAFPRTKFASLAAQARSTGKFLYIDPAGGPDFEFMKMVGHGLGDWPIFANPDFVVETEAEIAIVDWKTGKVPRNREAASISHQLALYAMWSREKFRHLDVGRDRIHVYEVYLPHTETFGGFVSDSDTSSALEYVEDSVRRMTACLSRPHDNHGEEEDFHRTDNPKKCTRCNFRKVCLEDPESATGGDSPL